MAYLYEPSRPVPNVLTCRFASLAFAFAVLRSRDHWIVSDEPLAVAAFDTGDVVLVRFQRVSDAPVRGSAMLRGTPNREA